jgi:transposase InsO family protein
VEGNDASVKKELVHDEDYATRDQARASIFEYIEVFYNNQRLHSSLGYVTPAAYEQSPFRLGQDRAVDHPRAAPFLCHTATA